MFNTLKEQSALPSTITAHSWTWSAKQWLKGGVALLGVAAFGGISYLASGWLLGASRKTEESELTEVDLDPTKGTATTEITSPDGARGVRSESVFPASFNLNALDGSNGFKLDGEAAGDLSGNSVDYAGDINGDGFDDLIIGAYLAPSGTGPGRSYVVFGHSGTWTSPVALSGLNGSNGFRLDGEADYDHGGNSVSYAGDINGDGIDDLIIGAYAADPYGSASGKSYVVFGHSGNWASPVALSELNCSNGFKLNGEVSSADLSGYSVSYTGDINGDGFDDLIIGAINATSGSSGRSYVVFGHNGTWTSPVALSGLNGSDGFKLDGEATYDQSASGISVSYAGDINGDGFDDLIIGAINASPSGLGSGRSYVVFGHNGTWTSPVALSGLNGSNGFKLDGETGGDKSGISVSYAGDINGDGFDDLIIGAYAADPSGSYSGRSYVVFGHNGTWTSPVALSGLNGSNGFKLNGEAAGDFSGISVSYAGDINGDGFDDLIIGANNASPSGLGSGRSYVVFGHNGTWTSPVALSGLNGSDGFKLDGEAANDNSGFSVSYAGDINGDGINDLVIGADWADPSGTGSGRSYVVFGRNASAQSSSSVTERSSSAEDLSSASTLSSAAKNSDLPSFSSTTSPLLSTAPSASASSSAEKINSEKSGGHFPTGAVVGGIVGGLGAVVCVGGLLAGIGIWKKRKREQEILDAKEDEAIELDSLGEKTPSSEVPEIKFQDLKLGKVLGKGGFGTVYQGLWKVSGTEVAIKRLNSVTADIPEEFANFEKEAAIMMKLRHPNIVQIYGVCRETTYCIVMEFMAGGALDKLLYAKSREIPWQPTRWQILKDCTCGLWYLHSQKIMHRDVKSGNILLDATLRAKWTDFGISRVISTESTQTKTIAQGTMAWMAPEIMDGGKHYTHKADVYSFGVLMWEVASRQMPYQEVTAIWRISQSVTSGERLKIPEDCDPKLAHLIQWCWKQNPEERPDMEKVKDDLDRITDAESSETSTTATSHIE